MQPVPTRSSPTSASSPLLSPLRLRLLSRQRAWQMLPSGSNVSVADGSARLHLCHCLGNSWVALPVLLQAGDSHTVERGGWIEIEAVGGPVHLQLLQPAPWFHADALWEPLRQLWAWLRTVFRAGGRGSALRGSHGRD